MKISLLFIMNLIKTIQRFIADIMLIVNNPYSCLDEEGVKIMREIEEMEKGMQNSPHPKNQTKN